MAATHRANRHIVIALMIGLASAPSIALSTADGTDPASRVRSEIGSLRRSLEEKPITGAGAEGLSSAVSGALDASSSALDAGRLYVSLEALRRAEGLVHGARFASEKEPTAGTGLPAFETEWAETSGQLDAGRRGGDNPRWTRSRAAIRALAETSEARIGPLLEGARGFAVATGPKDGLFYMGQARGEAKFAVLCASLTFEAKLDRYPLRSMLTELQRLQEKATAAFVPPRSIELHDRFIALNSTLKAGFELDASQAYAGSAYQYLEAVRHYAMLDAAPLDEPAQARVKQDLPAARAKIDGSARDESIAQLFLERAATQIDHPDGSAPTADEWRSARVILDRVLPAYSAARLPVASAKGSSGKTVRMTLVRWPYT
jgi:hypothetical protein